MNNNDNGFNLYLFNQVNINQSDASESRGKFKQENQGSKSDRSKESTLVEDTQAEDTRTEDAQAGDTRTEDAQAGDSQTGTMLLIAALFVIGAIIIINA